MGGDRRPIGVFDSGIGGLSVVRQLRRLLPGESIVYFADQAHVPYGSKAAGEIRRLSEQIVTFLTEQQQCKLIVVACNTASAAALDHLRSRFAQTPIVGMEPAVKPGARATRTGKVGVLATAGTFRSQRYASLMQRFAAHVELLEDPCLGLVELIEDGAVATPETAALLERVIRPMVQQRVDTLVLGCTHYPFVLPLIHQIAGDGVTVIDPAPAVARQVQRVLDKERLQNAGSGALLAYSSGCRHQLEQPLRQLLGWRDPVLAITLASPL